MYIRKAFIEFMAHRVYFPLIRWIYKPAYSPISSKILKACPQDSLGFHASLFLEKNGIEFFQGYEVHDLKHVLLNFDTDVRGEIMMQYFELGNGNKSLVVWIVIIFGLLLVPEGLKTYRQAYYSGKKASPISSVQLEKELMSPLQQLRKTLQIRTSL
jgi:hypothetical protein